MNSVTSLTGAILEKIYFTDYLISQYLALGTEVALNCGQSLDFYNMLVVLKVGYIFELPAIITHIILKIDTTRTSSIIR